MKNMNAWSYTSTPQYVFMVWCLVKNRDNFTFILCYVMLCYVMTRNSVLTKGHRYMKFGTEGGYIHTTYV